MLLARARFKQTGPTARGGAMTRWGGQVPPGGNIFLLIKGVLGLDPWLKFAMGVREGNKRE